MPSNEYTLRCCLKCGDLIKEIPIKCVGTCDSVCHVRCSGLTEQQLHNMENIGWRCNSCIEESQRKHSLKLESLVKQHEKRLEVLEQGMSSTLNNSRGTPILCPFLPHCHISRKAIIITAIIMGLTMVIGAILAVIFGMTALKMSLQVISVDGWGGRQSRNVLTPLNLPVHRVIISHTAAEGCESEDVCAARVRLVQNFHMDGYQWDQIGYNFLIGGDGLVYEGRGWDVQGTHTLGYNIDSIGIAFMGTFTKISPTERQLLACQLLLEEGERLKKLVPDYKLYGHRQLSATESPGDVLYGIIQKWPHWTNRTL